MSTLGADLQKEENARLSSTYVDALRGGGERAIVGGIGRVEANSQNLNRKIGADLDLQQKEIDANISQDDARIRAIREQRYQNDVSALSSQYNAAAENQAMAIGNGIRSVGSALSNVDYSGSTPQGVDSGAINLPLTTYAEPTKGAFNPVRF